jgi:methylmalonyl-CoA mutase C-terminal domain/subunit
VKRKIRVLIAKVGLDGHDVGARVVARSLSEAGMEVIYTGLRQRPEQIALAAIQESVDLIGISILSGSHMTLIGELISCLQKHEAGDIPVIAGGIIPYEDIKLLKEIGVSEVFLPETPMPEIVEYVHNIID